MDLPAHLYFYPPCNFNLYREYVSEQVTITGKQIFHGWTYYSGHFSDGEKFLMLGSDYFSKNDILSDLW